MSDGYSPLAKEIKPALISIDLILQNPLSRPKTFKLFAPMVNTWADFNCITVEHNCPLSYSQWQRKFLQEEVKIRKLFIYVLKEETKVSTKTALQSVIIQNTSWVESRMQTILVKDHIQINVPESDFNHSALLCLKKNPLFISAREGIKLDVPAETKLHLSFESY